MSVPSAIATPIAVAATPRASRARGGVVQGRIAKSGNPLRVAPRANRRPVASPMAARAVATGPDGYSADGMGCAELDEQLWEHEGHLKYRWEKFQERKASIADAEGSLAEFAKGYTKFGFNKTASGEIVFREWGPAACRAVLIGDFNGWNPDATHLEKDEYGVWSVTLPAGAIEHGSRVKIRMKKGDGAWVDRVPAWIKMSYSEPGVMGANYDGIYWDPPEHERYARKNPRPQKPPASRIYEAHVGMSGLEAKVNSYREFADDILPRIKDLGYNTVQLMAVMEHAYYGSFGYHVTSPFAVSSRCGNPEDLKYLVDAAHGMGIRVLLDVIHSHVSCNVEDGIAGFDFGQPTQDSYFGEGEAGYHWLWDSRLYNYENWEVQRYLLSNLRYWVDEYGFDGFRFDGITSMLYNHHGLQMEFSGDYNQYFGFDTNVPAVNYLMMANDMLHESYPGIEVIAEDVSGMPTLCRPVREGGIGFDARLAMAIPDIWVRLLQASREGNLRDEDWSMHDIVATLCNRRYTEKCIGYSESHDQSIVGSKTNAFWLMDAEMYDGMSTFEEASPVVDRGMALHKMLRLITMAIGGEGYLNFMGNEFGHPEWVDFPREGNEWSHDHCRRRWDLADTEYLRYYELNNFDRAMMNLDKRYEFLAHEHQWVSTACEERKLIVAERGPLIFVFNFHPTNTYEDLDIGVGMPGKYRITLDTDAWDFGGKGRVIHDAEHFTNPGGPESWVGPYEQEPRPCSMKVLSPARSAQVYFKVPEVEDPMKAAAVAAGVSEFREIRVSNAGADGAHSFDRAAAPTPPPAPAGGRPRGSFYDPDNVDPDFAPRGGMNSSQFRAAPVPPIAPSNYTAPKRREIVDDSNVDPDFRPRAPANFGSSAAAPAAPAAPAPPSNYTAPKRREIVDDSNVDPDFRPRAPANFGASSGGSPPPPPPASNVVSPVRRKEVVDPDNIDPDFR
jgi:1,4-alpha-glucan branching enzyme